MDMVDNNTLEECKFGHVLTQVVHEVHSLQVQNPNIPILLSKYDHDAAYMCLSVAIKFALLCEVAVANMVVYMCFRLSFRAKPVPALFSLVSKFVAELAQYQTWDPDHLQSRMLDDIDTTPIYCQVEFAPATPILFDYRPDLISIGVFINYLITVTLATPGLIM